MSKNKGVLQLLDFIGKLIDDRIAFNNLKKSDERKTTTRFGKSAIIYSVFFTALFSVGALLFFYAVAGKWIFLIAVFAVIIGLAFIIYSIPLLIIAVSHTVKQLILNRTAISFVALSVLILSLSGATVAFFAIITVI